MKEPSPLERELAFQIRAAKLARPERWHRFHPRRKWEFDFAWPEKLLAVEVEGGVWIGGRHNRASGFVKDIDKYNQACLLGWRLLRYTTKEINSGTALKEIEIALSGGMKYPEQKRIEELGLRAMRMGS